METRIGWWEGNEVVEPHEEVTMWCMREGIRGKRGRMERQYGGKDKKWIVKLYLGT